MQKTTDILPDSALADAFGLHYATDYARNILGVFICRFAFYRGKTFATVDETEKAVMPELAADDEDILLHYPFNAVTVCITTGLVEEYPPEEDRCPFRLTQRGGAYALAYFRELQERSKARDREAFLAGYGAPWPADKAFENWWTENNLPF